MSTETIFFIVIILAIGIAALLVAVIMAPRKFSDDKMQDHFGDWPHNGEQR